MPRFSSLTIRLFLAAALGILLLAGCGGGYLLRYDLNRKDVVVSKSAKSLKVQVATFFDKREAAERERSARGEKSSRDPGSYTHDEEFQGSVAEEITTMVISHLDYSRVFEPAATLASFGSENVSEHLLKSLGESGIDAVLTGQIEHFYGCYDRTLMEHMPESRSVSESLRERFTEHHVLLRAKLTSTGTYNVLWEDSFEIFASGYRTIPGIPEEERKFETAIRALRDSVNQMVESLEAAAFQVVK